MPDIVADLHLHSKYSRAVSPQMTPPVMAKFAEQKGIDLLTTGDWTHPLWFREIRSYLSEAEEGLYKIKNATEENEKTRFLLSAEIACIYSQGGKGRRIHNLVFVPSFETAEKVNKELVRRGYNITSDGRPILGLSSKHLLELILSLDERSLLIPAHAWTPWFGIYGQMSGFNSLAEAFEDLSSYIYAIETGLSSDPEMNWQIKELAMRSIVSFSDAHSPAKMGREATVFRLGNFSYESIRQAIMAPSKKTESTDNKVLYTIEFYPEEGKYHYSGHRNCNVRYTPEEMKTKGEICPVCSRKLTDGVMRRLQELASEEAKGKRKSNANGLVWITDPTNTHPPFVKLVPLLEIIAEALGVPVGSPKAKTLFDELCKNLQSELFILLHASLVAIQKIAGEKVAEGIRKVREAHISIQPGYDGVYGVVKIWTDENNLTKNKDALGNQMGIDF
ncbi:MAG TPA: endonuclease Q family protein [Patescibacteria group bacterium]|nr:endonuclease Q family protein [Patescibacteria group bacterium]